MNIGIRPSGKCEPARDTGRFGAVLALAGIKIFWAKGWGNSRFFRRKISFGHRAWAVGAIVHEASVAGPGGDGATGWSRASGCESGAAGHVSFEYAHFFVQWEKQQPDNLREKCVYHGDC